MASALVAVQVLVDWQNSPIGAGANAGNNFTDISDFIRFDKGLTIGRGRQDNISVVQPGRCTFTVRNDDGRFTPGKSTSPFFPGVILGRRVQVNVLDEVGVYHTRFDGQITEIDIDDTPTGQDSTVSFICADVLAFLNRFPAYSCWTVQETQFQGTPVLQYLCNEDQSAGVLRDSSGGGGPNLAPATYNNPPFYTQPTTAGIAYWDKPTYQFQSGSSPVEGAVDPLSFPTGQGYGTPVVSPFTSPLPSVFFSQTLEQGTVGNTDTTGAASAQFQGTLSTPVTVGAGKAFTLVAWVWSGQAISNTVVSNPFEIVCFGNTRTGAMLGLGVSASGGDYRYRANFYPNYPSNFSTFNSTGGPDSATYFILGAPIMISVVVDGTTASFYAGANTYKFGEFYNLTGQTTITIPSGTSFNYLSIGGPMGGGNGWVGNVSAVTLYDAALTPTQLARLAQYGAIGPERQTTGVAFQRAAVDYTGLPSYWTGDVDPGLSFCDYFDITGAGPGTVIQTLQSVEHGLVFTDAAGRLNFHDRSRRMGASTSPVTLPAGSYNAGIAPKVTDQYLVNYGSYSNARSGSGVVAQDTTSSGEYGVYPNGTVSSPTSAPYLSFAFNARALAATSHANQFYTVFTPRSVGDAANWDVKTQAQPTLKLASLTIDRLGNSPGQNEYVAPSTLYGIEINQSVTVGQNLPWWPDSPLASELFIEGVNETYSTGEATVSFYTSPAFQGRAWIPGNATYGQLDVSARVGISDVTSIPLASDYFNPTNGRALVYPPTPTYSSTMNRGAGSNGFIGAYDQAGISESLQRMLQPPLFFAGQKTLTQSFGFGTSQSLITWDNLFIDSASGFNFVNEAGVGYSVMVPGWYEVYATVVFGSPNTSNDYSVWITQNQTAAENSAGNRNIAPVTAKGTTGDLGLTTSAAIWCAVGDVIAVTAASNSSSWATAATNGGSSLSLRYLGLTANGN